LSFSTKIADIVAEKEDAVPSIRSVLKQNARVTRIVNKKNKKIAELRMENKKQRDMVAEWKK
jgi:hypothetical protein